MSKIKDFDIEKRIKEDNRKDPAIIYSYEDRFARKGNKYGAIDDELTITEDKDESDSKPAALSFILDILLDLIDI